MVLVRKETCNSKHRMHLRHPVLSLLNNMSIWLVCEIFYERPLHKRATNYRALLRKETYKDKAFYASLPPCSWHVRNSTRNPARLFCNLSSMREYRKISKLCEILIADLCGKTGANLRNSTRNPARLSCNLSYILEYWNISKLCETLIADLCGKTCANLRNSSRNPARLKTCLLCSNIEI